MPKIKVEIEVPKESCTKCQMYDNYNQLCMMFWKFIKYNASEDKDERCDECKQAEVKDEHSSN